MTTLDQAEAVAGTRVAEAAPGGVRSSPTTGGATSSASPRSCSRSSRSSTWSRRRSAPIPSLTSAQLIPEDVTLDNFRRILSGHPGEAGTEQEALDVPYTSWYLNTILISGAIGPLLGLLRRARRVRVRALPLQGAADGDDVAAAHPDVPDVPRGRRDLPDRPAHRRRLPGDRAQHAHERHPRLPRRRARGEHVADEGVPRLDPGLARRVRARRRRDARAGLLGDHPARSRRPCSPSSGCSRSSSTINEFIIASRLLQSTDKFTLPVGLYGFINDQYAQQWGPFCAGVVLAAIPVVILFFFLQRFIVEGLTRGAVKG